MLNNKFSKGDKVVTDDCACWLTVIEVRANGWYRCRFGSIGGDAGSYKEKELSFYTGK